MTTVVVTGAGGYLGAAVTVAASRVATVRPVTRRPSPWLPGEVLLCDDLVAAAEAAVEGADAVVHLAGANEIASRDDPDGALAATARLARAVGEACRRQNVARLVYVSTIHVYGAALAGTAGISEELIPKPRSVYSITRLACEHLLASTVGDEALVVLRLSNAVGAPADSSIDRWSLLANDLCRRAAAGLPLELRTPGGQRDFIALSDVGRIVVAACYPERVDAGTYNLASGSTMTVAEMASLVAEESEKAGMGRPEIIGVHEGFPQMSHGQDRPQGRIGPVPTAAVDKRYRIDTSRLASSGLSAEVPLATAVAETLQMCRNQIGGWRSE